MMMYDRLLLLVRKQTYCTKRRTVEDWRIKLNSGAQLPITPCIVPQRTVPQRTVPYRTVRELINTSTCKYGTRTYRPGNHSIDVVLYANVQYQGLPEQNKQITSPFHAPLNVGFSVSKKPTFL